MTKSREDFEAHTAVPANNLPDGLVLRDHNPKCLGVIYKTEFRKNHEAYHTCLKPDPDSSEDPANRDTSFARFPAKVLMNVLKHRENPFLTPDEFDEFIEKHPKTLKALQEYCGIECFVRSVPDIEIFVRDAEAAKRLQDLTEYLEGYAQIGGLDTIQDLEFQRKNTRWRENIDEGIYTIESGPMILTLESLVKIYRQAPKNATAFWIGIPRSYDPEVRLRYLSEYDEANRIFRLSNSGTLWPILYFAKIMGTNYPEQTANQSFNPK